MSFVSDVLTLGLVASNLMWTRAYTARVPVGHRDRQPAVLALKSSAGGPVYPPPRPPADSGQPTMPRSEAAKALGCSERTVRRLGHPGCGVLDEVPVPGRETHVTVASVDRRLGDTGGGSS
jgi:hypothetical protein